MQYILDAVQLQITMGEPALLVVVGFVFLLGLVAVYFGYSTYQTGQLLEETETEDAESVTPGRSVVTGVARPAGETLEHPFTGEECLYYDYEVRELVEKEGQRDRERDEYDGPRETEWKNAGGGGNAVPFYIEDGTGEILVEADRGTTFEIVGNGDTLTENEMVKLGYDVGPITIKAERDARKHRIKKRETTYESLPPGEEVFVFGSVTDTANDTDTEEPAIGEDRETGKFVVSNEGKDSLASSYSRTGPIVMAVGTLLSASMLGILVYDLIVV